MNEGIGFSIRFSIHSCSFSITSTSKAAVIASARVIGRQVNTSHRDEFRSIPWMK